MSELAVMTEEKCLSLLQGSTVGRVALCMPEGPQIFPVNFTVRPPSAVAGTAS